MLDRMALIFVILGGIDMGSRGLFRFDIISWICGGPATLVSRIVYTVVGLSALWCVSLLFRQRTEILDD